MNHQLGSRISESDGTGQKERSLKFYEFFAGAGMARLGLSPQWTCAWANDNDPQKNLIYAHNWGNDHLDGRDVARVAVEIGEGLPQEEGTPVFPRSVHMAWASFPCQDLSLAGWRRGMGAGRSGAYWPFWQLMYSLEKRPPIMVIENVAGLLYGDNFLGLCESLAALGLKFGALLIDARHFLPQSRPRVFVIAVNASLDVSSFVDRNHVPGPWYNKAVLAAYDRLPAQLKEHWLWWRLKTPEQKIRPVVDLVEQEPEDVSYHSAEETRKLLAMMTPRNLDRVRMAGEAGCLQVGFLYKRMRNRVQRAEVRFDGYSGCLRTPKGGSSRQTILLVEGEKIRSRLLSRLEAARLMGIDLDEDGRLPGASHGFFPESCSYNQAYMAMGDGVAVPVVKHLGDEIITPLALRWNELEGNRSPEKAAVQSPYLERVGERIQSWEVGVSGDS